MKKNIKNKGEEIPLFNRPKSLITGRFISKNDVEKDRKEYFKLVAKKSNASQERAKQLLSKAKQDFQKEKGKTKTFKTYFEQYVKERKAKGKERNLETGRFESKTKAQKSNYKYLWELANKNNITKEKAETLRNLALETFDKNKHKNFKDYFSKTLTAWKQAQTSHIEKIEERYLDRFLQNDFKIIYNGQEFSRNEFLLYQKNYLQSLPVAFYEFKQKIKVDEKNKTYTIEQNEALIKIYSQAIAGDEIELTQAEFKKIIKTKEYQKFCRKNDLTPTSQESLEAYAEEIAENGLEDIKASTP